MNSEPRIYLFLSVDVISSTELKYNEKIDWIREITDFYSAFTNNFKDNIERIQVSYNLRNTDSLTIWKYSGDEILFYINISENNQIEAIIDAFALTLEKLNIENKILKFKGTAWLGQIPFIDIEFVTEETNGNRLTDFIGTSIDCGFRLGKYSNETYLVISMEIAYICVLNKYSQFQRKIIFLRKQNLKGVLGDFEYPIFALKLKVPYDEENLVIDPTSDSIKSYIDNLFKSKKIEKFTKTHKLQLIDKSIAVYLKSNEIYSREVAEKYPTIKTIDELDEIKNSKTKSSSNKSLFNNLKDRLEE